MRALTAAKLKNKKEMSIFLYFQIKFYPVMNSIYATSKIII